MKLTLSLLSVLLGATAAFSAPPAGFTEPPVVFYGSVTQTADGHTLTMTSGQLVFTITPASGQAFQVRTALNALPGGLSYRLEIPVAKVPAGFRLATATLPAAGAPQTHQRGDITLDGLPASISSPTGPNAPIFSFAENQRGKIERVDLTVAAPFTDTDGDGLPDWWEDQHGLNKYDPSDASLLDVFGYRTLLEDYQRRINPQLGSEYDQWVAPRVAAAERRHPQDDVDGDGIPNALEFALDTDPGKSDAALAGARRAVQVERFGSADYLTMTVEKPGRTTVAYKVESSGDGQWWGSIEGSAIVTLSDTATQLKVRDVAPLASGGKRFLRLRVELTQ